MSYSKSSPSRISDEFNYEYLPRYERMVLMKDWQELHHNYRNLEHRLDTMQSDLSQVRLRTTELKSNLQDHVKQCSLVERRLTSLHGEYATLSVDVSGLKRQYVDNRATSALTTQEEGMSVLASHSNRQHEKVTRKKIYPMTTSDYRKSDSCSFEIYSDDIGTNTRQTDQCFDGEVLPDSPTVIDEPRESYTLLPDLAIHTLSSEKPTAEELNQSDSYNKSDSHQSVVYNQHQDRKIVQESIIVSDLDLESEHMSESNVKSSSRFEDVTFEGNPEEEFVWVGAAQSDIQKSFRQEVGHNDVVHCTGYLDGGDDDESGSLCSVATFHRRDSDSGFVSKVLHESAVLQSCTSTPKTTSRHEDASVDSIQSSADTNMRVEPDGAGDSSSLATREALSTYSWQFFQVFDRLVDRRMSRKTRSRYVPDSCSSTESTKESGPSDTDWDTAHGSLIDMKRRSRRAILRRLTMSEGMLADLQTFSSTLGHGLSDYFDTSSVTYDEVKNLLSWIQPVRQEDFRRVVQLEDVGLSDSLREALRVAIATVHATLHPSKDSEDNDRDSSVDLHPIF